MNFILTTVVIMFVVCTLGVKGETKKHGYLAKKLDEYYSTVKCMANIMEDFIPGKTLCCKKNYLAKSK